MPSRHNTLLRSLMIGRAPDDVDRSVRPIAHWSPPEQQYRPERSESPLPPPSDMTPDEFKAAYRPGQQLTSEGIRTTLAQETRKGRIVLVHELASAPEA